MYSDKIQSFCGVKIDIHTSLRIKKKFRKIPKHVVSHHIIKSNALQNTLLYQP